MLIGFYPGDTLVPELYTGPAIVLRGSTSAPLGIGPLPGFVVHSTVRPQPTHQAVLCGLRKDKAMEYRGKPVYQSHEQMTPGLLRSHALLRVEYDIKLMDAGMCQLIDAQ
ncbi:hypothetical protein J7T55_010399 [Diaporthe amygdali]|uniref:uncharacterized protein n=1 Tax=Phomopsis amygdali TaxID=1214568 RepID=UPI0022FDFFDE|nr:uncharacterized protein J7T55_010399 [Diaporthe amygdali]KAJ0115576.1 hypothetical protein J7T55_010399 [Diaporthe amygdali]